MALIALSGASRMPTAVVGTIVLTVAFGFGRGRGEGGGGGGGRGRGEGGEREEGREVGGWEKKIG